MNTGVRSSFQIIQMIDEIPQSMLKFGVILLSFQLKEKCKNSAYIGYLRNITLASIVLCVAVICVTDFCSIRLFIEKYRNFWKMSNICRISKSEMISRNSTYSRNIIWKSKYYCKLRKLKFKKEKLINKTEKNFFHI